MKDWRAFWRGFLSGLAGPALIFTIPKIELPPRRSVEDALADDWRKVGDDMRKAMAQYAADREEIEALQRDIDAATARASGRARW